MRLIDGDALIKQLDKRKTYEIMDGRNKAYGKGVRDAMRDVADAPTVATDNNVLSKWISVKDKLPEPEEKVLIYTKTGCLKYAQYHEEPNVLNPWYVYEDQARAWTNVISHWMPLPSTEGLDET